MHFWISNLRYKRRSKLHDTSSIVRIFSYASEMPLQDAFCIRYICTIHLQFLKGMKQIQSVSLSIIYSEYINTVILWRNRSSRSVIFNSTAAKNGAERALFSNMSVSHVDIFEVKSSQHHLLPAIENNCKKLLENSLSLTFLNPLDDIRPSIRSIISVGTLWLKKSHENR